MHPICLQRENQVEMILQKHPMLKFVGFVATLCEIFGAVTIDKAAAETRRASCFFLRERMTERSGRSRRRTSKAGRSTSSG